MVDDKRNNILIDRHTDRKENINKEKKIDNSTYKRQITRQTMRETDRQTNPQI